MVASHLIWLLRTKDIRSRAKDAGQTFDSSEEGIQWQSKGVDLESKFLRLFAKKHLPRDDPEPDVESANTFVAPEHVVPKTVPNAVV